MAVLSLVAGHPCRRLDIVELAPGRPRGNSSTKSKRLRVELSRRRGEGLVQPVKLVGDETCRGGIVLGPGHQRDTHDFGKVAHGAVEVPHKSPVIDPFKPMRFLNGMEGRGATARTGGLGNEVIEAAEELTSQTHD